MASFLIEGGHLLRGNIQPQGAKNEALQLICATLLTQEPVRLRNLPDILDVNNLIDLLREMGVQVERNGEGDFTFCARSVSLSFLQSEAYTTRCTRLRGSVLLLGPLLARFGEARLSRPGGDKIGRRRLDTHLLGLSALGGMPSFDAETGVFSLTAPDGGLRGAYILLDEASVTGTANIIMAACTAKGTTTIYNAACEPYIQGLCKLLQAMGAEISGVGSNLLTIRGVDRLHGAEHTCAADFIEIGSFIGLGAICGDGITIQGAAQADLGIIPATFRRLGVQIETRGADLYIPRQDDYAVESFFDGSFMAIADAPWPGLTPDLISVLLVVAVAARGHVLFHQKMFESRLFFVDKLIDMGAGIVLCDPHRAVVVGSGKSHRLRGRRMASPDIRAGIALLLAALSADGTSRIDNVEQIDRGYQHIEQRLTALGAHIQRIE